jgi:hypothetical protein
MMSHSLHVVTLINNVLYTVILPKNMPDLTENSIRSWAKDKSSTAPQRIDILECDAKFKRYNRIDNLTELQAHEMRVELLERTQKEGSKKIINSIKRCSASLIKHREAATL